MGTILFNDISYGVVSTLGAMNRAPTSYWDAISIEAIQFAIYS